VEINRVLVTGAAGMVGSYVKDVFHDCELLLTDVDGFTRHGAALDVCDPAAVTQTLQHFQPDIVLHLAGATDVDRCQGEPDWAFGVNTIGTQNVAEACEANRALLVYVSTGNVFSGEKDEAYTEFDATGPGNVYGESKLAGERIVASRLNRYYIVRAGWMIGGGKKDKKFVGKITRMILEGKMHLKAVNDKFGSPTYALDLLRGISRLLDTHEYGLYHMVNPGAPSRYEFALAVREILKRPEVEIEPVSSAFFPMLVPRIRMEAMRNFKLELLGFDWMRPWSVAVRDYLEHDLLPALSEEEK
tara:strand:- start:328 stop:1233 length:906 start_codon:yes stop_codon:yes gene_type:complete